MLTVRLNSRFLQGTYSTISLDGIYLCMSVHKVFIVMETCGSMDLGSRFYENEFYMKEGRGVFSFFLCM